MNQLRITSPNSTHITTKNALSQHTHSLSLNHLNLPTAEVNQTQLQTTVTSPQVYVGRYQEDHTPSQHNLHSTPFTAQPSQHTLRSTPFTAQPSQHTLHSTPFTAQPSQHNLHSTPFTAQPSQHTLHSTTFTAQPSQHTLHSTTFTAQPSQHTLHSTPFTAHPSQHQYSSHATPNVKAGWSVVETNYPVTIATHHHSLTLGFSVTIPTLSWGKPMWLIMCPLQ